LPEIRDRKNGRGAFKSTFEGMNIVDVRFDNLNAARCEFFTDIL
jgi:hypothetical protein